MFDNYKNSFNKEFLDIFDNQEEGFAALLNFYPQIGKFYKSPFRVDKEAGCRFEYNKKGKLFLIDNAGINNKIFFSVIDTCMQLYSLTFEEALLWFRDNISVKKRKSLKTFKNNLRINFKPIIYYKRKDWDDNNYFTRDYGISIDYLNHQPYYSVSEYWYNTKNNWNVRKNCNLNPTINDVIAYQFENTIKLYFPQAEKYKNLKFYTDCTNELFGWHRMDQYLSNEDKDLYILSGGKDELVLNYHFGLNTLGLQHERLKQLPKDFYTVLPEFDNIYILLDNDNTGREHSLYLKNKLGDKSKILYLTQFNDVADYIKNNKCEDLRQVILR